jgi:hypothetical protein
LYDEARPLDGYVLKAVSVVQKMDTIQIYVIKRSAS